MFIVVLLKLRIVPIQWLRRRISEISNNSGYWQNKFNVNKNSTNANQNKNSLRMQAHIFIVF